MSVWYLAQRLKIQLSAPPLATGGASLIGKETAPFWRSFIQEDITTKISVRVTFHLPIRDGVSREPLPTGVSPQPVFRDALILEFISSFAR